MKLRVLMVAFVAAMFVAETVVAAESQGDPSPVRDDRVRHRSLSAIQRDLHDALRAEALTRRRGQNAPEVIRLVELYREMAVHPQRHDSRFLARMGWRLRSRLEIVRDHIERHAARQDRNAKKKDIRPVLMAPETPVLAQQFAGAGAAAPAAGGQPAGAGARAGAGGIINYGPELVELIQATISPSTWDINGGNGSIVYFSPLRVLVVSAPGEVHGDVADVLGQLRAAP